MSATAIAHKFVGLFSLLLGMACLAATGWCIDQGAPLLITIDAVLLSCYAIGWSFYFQARPAEQTPKASHTQTCDEYSAVRFRTPEVITEFCMRCRKRRKFKLNETRAFYECTANQPARHQWCGHRVWIEEFPPPATATDHIHDLYKEEL